MFKKENYLRYSILIVFLFLFACATAPTKSAIPQGEENVNLFATEMERDKIILKQAIIVKYKSNYAVVSKYENVKPQYLLEEKDPIKIYGIVTGAPILLTNEGQIEIPIRNPSSLEHFYGKEVTMINVIQEANMSLYLVAGEKRISNVLRLRVPVTFKVPLFPRK